MNQAVPYEIREALGMPDADVRTACERIRTMRHTEQMAGALLQSGRLCPPKGRLLAGDDVAAAPAVPKRKLQAVKFILLFTVLFAAFAALAWGWTVLVDQPQAATWMTRIQSEEHPRPDTERLLRAARRQHSMQPQTPADVGK